MTNIEIANCTNVVEVAAPTTASVMPIIPIVMETTRFPLSTMRPRMGEPSPANSPIISATPICATLTSKPRAMTAINGGAKR